MGLDGRVDGPPGEKGFQRRWRGGGLGRLVLVATADLDGDQVPELIALAGRDLKLFDWTGDTYALWGETSLPREGLALAAGPLGPGEAAGVAVGTRDSVYLYARVGGELRQIAQSLLYPNAYFRSISLSDINGDGKAEVIAAASGAQTMYVYQVMARGGETRLEELGRVYIGGLVGAEGIPAGDPGVVTATKDGYVDVYVPCSLVPTGSQTLYTVKRGDNLWRIARRFQLPVGTIARINRLTEPYHLTPGQILLIPTKQ